MNIDKKYIEQNLLSITNNIKSITLQKINKENNTNITIEELYLIYHDAEKPKCECGNYLNFNSFKKGYNRFCSSTCNFKKEHVKRKMNKTKLEKYGDKNYSNREKATQTMKENNNGEYFSDESKSKIKSTKLEKYGNKNYTNIEKTKKTKLEKYGTIGYNNSEKRNTTREKNKLNGVIYSNSDNRNYHNLNKDYILQNFIKDEELLREQMMKYYNFSFNTMHVYLREFGIKYKSNLSQTSIAEKEILDYIRKQIVNVIHRDKLLINKELDIYVPEHKFAIEYNGLLWHSYNPYQFPTKDQKENKNRHFDKSYLAEEKGIQLFHIFENEWLDPVKQEIWKSVINSKLGLHKRIYARKTEIRMVQNKEKDMFLDNNHLQGTSISGINIGLYYKNELVSIMTFGKSRFSKKYEYELLRFASKLNTTVIGGGSKMIKFFEDAYKPKSLISYANRRWSTGNFYEQVQFTFSHNSSPNYFYFKGNSYILESRNKYQKHKLSKVLDIFDENKTESENMFLNGYRRIYDSGNKIYKKEYK